MNLLPLAELWCLGLDVCPRLLCAWIYIILCYKYNLPDSFTVPIGDNDYALASRFSVRCKYACLSSQKKQGFYQGIKIHKIHKIVEWNPINNDYLEGLVLRYIWWISEHLERYVQLSSTRFNLLPTGSDTSIQTHWPIGPTWTHTLLIRIICAGRLIKLGVTRRRRRGRESK